MYAVALVTLQFFTLAGQTFVSKALRFNNVTHFTENNQKMVSTRFQIKVQEHGSRSGGAHLRALAILSERFFHKSRRQDTEKERLKDTEYPTSVVGNHVSEECHGEGFFETDQSTCSGVHSKAL